GNRFEALEPLRRGVREHFGAFEKGIASGLAIRHDHGSASMSGDFQQELSFLGMTSSPSFVREPEGKGYTASCTSFVFSGDALGNRRGSVLLIPCCLSGLFVPTGSYRYSGLSL